MAVNESRSMNADLREGITDGVLKKVNPNRGGTPNDDMSQFGVWDNLSDELYGTRSLSSFAKDEYADRLTTVKG